MDFKLAFKVLGIDVTQNEDEIKNAYRELLPGCNQIGRASCRERV